MPKRPPRVDIRIMPNGEIKIKGINVNESVPVGSHEDLEEDLKNRKVKWMRNRNIIFTESNPRCVYIYHGGRWYRFCF